MPIGRQVLTGKPILASGQRTKRVTIQQRGADAAGDSGRPVETWTTLHSTVYMGRSDLRADELYVGNSNQLSASMETQWHSPYFADCDPELVDVPKLRRLSFEGRTFDILSATMIGEKRGIEFVTLAQGRR